MADPRAEVRNAADRGQVKRAARREQRAIERERAWFRALLQTPFGRAAMATLIRRAGVYRSIYHASALIHYNAGRQDFGHELMATLLDADEDAYTLMETEARQRATFDARERDAGHTAGASENLATEETIDLN